MFPPSWIRRPSMVQDRACSSHGAFEALLSSCELAEHRMKGDGNCQFRSLAYCLWGEDIKHREKHREVRTAVVEEMWRLLPHDASRSRHVRQNHIWQNHIWHRLQSVLPSCSDRIVKCSSSRTSQLLTRCSDYFEVLMRSERSSRLNGSASISGTPSAPPR